MKRRVCLLLGWPPSVNGYYGNKRRGGKYLLPEVVEFRAHVQAAVFEQEPGVEPLMGKLRFRMTLWPPDHRERDADNLLKATQDALQHAGIYERDSQIKRLAVHMKDEVREGGQALVQISEAA